MTPGQKVLKAFAERGYSVKRFDRGDPFPITVGDSEIAGLIEQESGIVELARALELLLSNERTFDANPSHLPRARAALAAYRDQA
jgi:glycosyltransferase involved in cell wall biosynthesis